MGTHKVKVRRRDCAGNWSDYSNEVTFTITESEQNLLLKQIAFTSYPRNWELIEIQGSNVYAELGEYTAINYDGNVVATTEEIIDTAPINGGNIEI